MDRSSFLQLLFGSLAIGKLPKSITQEFRKIYLLQDFVAGFRFYEGLNLLTQMKEGDLLELVREPLNEYDSGAVALHWQGKKIGFVPSAINEMLSYLIDANALSLFGVITHLEKEVKPWENVAFAIYFVQEVNHALPAHASYLTIIEAPHYRTLSRKNKTTAQADPENEPDLPTLDELFEETNRVVNLDRIPENKPEIRQWLEKNPCLKPAT